MMKRFIKSLKRARRIRRIRNTFVEVTTTFMVALLVNTCKATIKVIARRLLEAARTHTTDEIVEDIKSKATGWDEL